MGTLLIRDIKPDFFDRFRVVAVLGNFDGLHLGHRRLIDRLISCKKDLIGQTVASAVTRPVKSMLVSFFPPPLTVIDKALAPAQLMSLRQKYEILSDLQIDFLCVLRFNQQLAALSAERFISEILLGQLNIEILIVGSDAGVGRGREGGSEFIASKLQQNGRRAEIVPLLELEGSKISSRQIRNSLQDGNIRRVTELLGRPYTLSGKVVSDQRRGKVLGFATANIALRWQFVPRFGVYLTRTHLAGKTYPSLTSIGERPTFGSKGVSVETHLLNYHGPDFYGARIVVDFEKYLRAEIKFSCQQSLIAQIEDDISEARRFFASAAKEV